MARVTIVPKLEGLGVGVLDEFLEKKDVEAARTDIWKKWSTWERLVLLAGGAVAEYMGFYPQYTEPLATAGATLVGKTAMNWIQSQTGSPAAAQVMVTRARAPVQRTTVTRTYEPEFKSAKAF